MTRFLLFFLLLSGLGADASIIIRPYVPLDVQVERATAIVIAQLVAEEPGPMTERRHRPIFGRLRVSEVMRGSLKGPIRVDYGDFYGIYLLDQGIWLLEWDEKLAVYHTREPFPITERAEIEQAMEGLQNRPYLGAPDGLQLYVRPRSAQVHRNEGLGLALAVRNDSNNPVTLSADLTCIVTSQGRELKRLQPFQGQALAAHACARLETDLFLDEKEMPPGDYELEIRLEAGAQVLTAGPFAVRRTNEFQSRYRRPGAVPPAILVPNFVLSEDGISLAKNEFDGLSTYYGEFQRDGLILSSPERAVRWSLADGKPESIDPPVIESRTLSPDGTWQVGPGGPEFARVWEVGHPERGFYLGRADGDWPTCAFSPDSRYVVQRDERGPLVWSLETGELDCQLTGREPTFLAFSRDGHWLASGMLAEGSCQIYDFPARRLVATLANYGSGWLVLSPDGRYDGSEGAERYFLEPPNPERRTQGLLKMLLK